MAKNRAGAYCEEDEDGPEDIFALSAEGLRKRALRAIEDEDAWSLAECFEAGASAEGLLERSARASCDCLVETQKRLEAQGLPRCSAEALEAAAGSGWPTQKVSALLFANAKDAAPLSDDELGAREAIKEAIEDGKAAIVAVWVRKSKARASGRLSDGRSFLELAAGLGEGECARELIRAGANPNATGLSGASLMISALSLGYAHVADALEEGGAQGPLSREGEEDGLIKALRGAGHEKWAARIERERLDRQTEPEAGAKGAKRPRGSRI